MIGTVYTKIYSEPPLNIKEALRYAGAKNDAPEVTALLTEVFEEVKEKLCYKVCFAEFEVKHDGEFLDLGFCKTESKNLKQNLINCQSVVLFAATVGLELDRYVVRYEKTSPSKRLLLQALGAERVESLCDCFNSEITAEKCSQGKFTRPRFSPGYGDLPLELQREIFAVLNCPQRIGVSLNESLFMTPSKSVTAIIGVGEKIQEFCYENNGIH